MALRTSASWSTSAVPQQFQSMASGHRLIWVAKLKGGRGQESEAPQPRLQPSRRGDAGGGGPASGIVGTVTLEWGLDDPELADGRTCAHVSNLVVHPAYRRRGIGRALTAAAEEVAAQRRYTAITIGVDEPNTYARRLYERWGYRWYKDTMAAWGRVHVLRRVLARG